MKKIFIAKEELKEVYDNLKCQKEVAKHFGVSLKVIKRLVKEYQLGTYEHFAYIPPREEILEVFQNGGKKRDVCEKFGVKNSTVSKWLVHYGISAIQSDYKHLTQDQVNVVIGSVLGDGCLDGRVLYLNHSIKQEDYLNYKADFFANNISESSYRTTKDGHRTVRRRTRAFGEIKELRSLFYKGKKKIIPDNLKELLNPLSVAIWYMDDGSKNGKNYGKICTNCFTSEEVEFLSNTLNDLIGITTYPQKDRDYFVIRIPVKNRSFEKFCDYIRDYVPDCMKYKLLEKV